MPTHCTSDSGGCYCQWGGHGAKYKYECGNKEARERARSKANAQGRATHAGGYKGSYSTGFKGK